MATRDLNCLNETLKNYLAQVDAKKPVPGGGSVVAYVASLSAALIGMVLNYTGGKEQYNIYKGDLVQIKIENDNILQKLSLYVEKDVKLYNNIRKYTKKDPAIAEKYLKESVQLHLDICQKAYRLAEFSEYLSRKGNENLISDTGIAAELALSSFKTAKINILINLKYLSSKSFCREVSTEVDRLEAETEKKAETAYLEVVKKLRGL